MKHTIRKIKSLARANLMCNYRLAIRVFLLASMIPMVIDSIYSLVEGDTATLLNDIIFYLVEFIILVVSNVCAMGQIRVHLFLARHEQTQSNDIFFAFTHCSDHFFLGAIIRTVISVIASSPLYGAVYIYNSNYTHLTAADLLYIAGFCLLALLLNVITALELHPFFYLLMEFNDMPLVFALKESMRLMKGNKFRLLRLYLSFAGMLLLCILSLGIGFLWIAPYYSQSKAVFYLDVIEEVAEWKPQPEQTYYRS